MSSVIQRLINDQRGISAVEYSLLLALLGAGILTALFALGGEVASDFDEAKSALVLS